jgi:hypothetical protein
VRYVKVYPHSGLLARKLGLGEQVEVEKLLLGSGEGSGRGSHGKDSDDEVYCPESRGQKGSATSVVWLGERR